MADYVMERSCSFGGVGFYLNGLKKENVRHLQWRTLCLCACGADDGTNP